MTHPQFTPTGIGQQAICAALAIAMGEVPLVPKPYGVKYEEICPKYEVNYESCGAAFLSLCHSETMVSLCEHFPFVNDVLIRAAKELGIEERKVNPARGHYSLFACVISYNQYLASHMLNEPISSPCYIDLNRTGKRILQVFTLPKTAKRKNHAVDLMFRVLDKMFISDDLITRITNSPGEEGTLYNNWLQKQLKIPSTCLQLVKVYENNNISDAQKAHADYSKTLFNTITPCVFSIAGLQTLICQYVCHCFR